jgi:hypothetical protein
VDGEDEEFQLAEDALDALSPRIGPPDRQSEPTKFCPGQTLANSGAIALTELVFYYVVGRGGIPRLLLGSGRAQPSNRLRFISTGSANLPFRAKSEKVRLLRSGTELTPARHVLRRWLPRTRRRINRSLPTRMRNTP